MMEQARLIVMADFALPRNGLQQVLSEVRLLDWTSIAGFPAFRIGMLFFPESVESQIAFEGRNAEGDVLMQWCGIHIRISRNLIEFQIPALYKTWSDFPYFRMGLNRFLSTFLRPFQCKNLLFIPSRWTQRESSIHNAWQRKRLQQMQLQITSGENSFKRCRMHLQHCLGESRPHAHSETYPTYAESDFFHIDAGPLRISAALRTPITADSLPLYARQITALTDFYCIPEWRDNACPYRSYNRYRPSEVRACRLYPHYETEKYPDLQTSILTEGRARWNAHCFFSMELHSEYVNLLFHRGAPELLYGSSKTKMRILLQYILKEFSVREMLLYSEYCLDELSENTGFDNLKQHLSSHYIKYSRAEDMDSWSEGYIEITTVR